MDFTNHKTKIVLLAVLVAVIIFIGAMVGSSLRKLTTEEGNLL